MNNATDDDSTIRRRTVRITGVFLLWGPAMLLFSSEEAGRRQGG